MTDEPGRTRMIRDWPKSTGKEPPWHYFDREIEGTGVRARCGWVALNGAMFEQLDVEDGSPFWILKDICPRCMMAGADGATEGPPLTLSDRPGGA